MFPAFAQIDGRITGSVVDISGAAVPGAQVDLLMVGGKKALLTSKTSSDGLYHFIGVRPGYYDLAVEAAGFVKTTLSNVSVDPPARPPCQPFKLQLCLRQHKRRSQKRLQGVQTANAEVSQTISMEEINNLPILDRDALSVIQTQAGVVDNGNSYTVINGLRTSYSDVTLDGINMQDNYIRDNALDYLPNKLLLGQVRQMTIVSSNGNSAASGRRHRDRHVHTLRHRLNFTANCSSITATTRFLPTIGSTIRPAWLFRFSTRIRAALPSAGLLKKDKLFFYINYEFVRTHAQLPRKIPF